MKIGDMVFLDGYRYTVVAWDEHDNICIQALCIPPDGHLVTGWVARHHLRTIALEHDRHWIGPVPLPPK